MILVTGGAGFIGSNIVARLCADGHDVAVADRLGKDNKWRNISKRPLMDLIAPEATLDWIAHHAGDLSGVVHMGAISATTETDVDLIIAQNYHLSCSLWTLCAQHGLPFVYASSAATYGDGTQGFDDDASPQALAALRPMNPYGWSKLLFDQFTARQVARSLPRPPQHVGLRFFNVYGPNEYHKGSMQSVIAHMFPAASTGNPVTLFRSHNPAWPDGGQKRDFIHVADCTDVVAWLLAHPDVSGLFNVGTGKARSFNDLAHALFTALGRKAEILFTDTPEAIRDRYQYFTQARMDRLRQAGYTRPFTELEAGTADYVQRYLMQADRYA